LQKFFKKELYLLFPTFATGALTIEREIYANTKLLLAKTKIV